MDDSCISEMEDLIVEQRNYYLPVILLISEKKTLLIF